MTPGCRPKNKHSKCHSLFYGGFKIPLNRINGHFEVLQFRKNAPKDPWGLFVWYQREGSQGPLFEVSALTLTCLLQTIYLVYEQVITKH